MANIGGGLYSSATYTRANMVYILKSSFIVRVVYGCLSKKKLYKWLLFLSLLLLYIIGDIGNLQPAPGVDDERARLLFTEDEDNPAK